MHEYKKDTSVLTDRQEETHTQLYACVYSNVSRPVCVPFASIVCVD